MLILFTKIIVPKLDMSGINHKKILQDYEKFISSYNVLNSIYADLRRKMISQQHFNKKIFKLFH